MNTDSQPTLLYLVRHAATEANLARPARLQGQRDDPPLAPIGVRQAEATGAFLARLKIDACYCSPLKRAAQTAGIIAAPHGLTPRTVAQLTECDVGRWSGLDWDAIRARDPEAYRLFHDDPTAIGYPEGESFADVHRRAAPVLEELLLRHAGQAVLVVSHHIVNRTYLAGLLGLATRQAKRISLDNCGISVVLRHHGNTRVNTLNAAFHLNGLAA